MTVPPRGSGLTLLGGWIAGGAAIFLAISAGFGFTLLRLAVVTGFAERRVRSVQAITSSRGQYEVMEIDLAKTSTFMTTHARLVDRRRFDLITGRGDSDGLHSALAGYRNPDGGFGWGLEPDLRSPESQPAGALHAFEVFEEIGPETSKTAERLCDWRASVNSGKCTAVMYTIGATSRQASATRPIAWRRAQLEALRALLTENDDELCDAL